MFLSVFFLYACLIFFLFYFFVFFFFLCVLLVFFFFFFFKHKTAYDMRISDWSSDVCSSDLLLLLPEIPATDYSHRVKFLTPFVCRNSNPHRRRAPSFRRCVCPAADRARAARARAGTPSHPPSWRTAQTLA